MLTFRYVSIKHNDYYITKGEIRFSVHNSSKSGLFN